MYKWNKKIRCKSIAITTKWCLPGTKLVPLRLYSWNTSNFTSASIYNEFLFYFYGKLKITSRYFHVFRRWTYNRERVPNMFTYWMFCYFTRGWQQFRWRGFWKSLCPRIKILNCPKMCRVFTNYLYFENWL